MMSTVYNANEWDFVKRNVNVRGKWEKHDVQRPIAIKDYNKFNGGVDLSDQLIGKYNDLRKVNQWWKTIFYHLIDIAVINSYVMFRACAKKYYIAAIERKKTYGQSDFREEFIEELAGIDVDDDETDEEKEDGYHKYELQNQDESRNCGWCYHTGKTDSGRGKEMKVKTFCSVCQKHFCHTTKRDCISVAHERDNVHVLQAILSKRKDK